MTAERLTFRAAPWLWALLSVAAWVASFFVAFAVLAGAGTVGLLMPNLGGLRTELAVLLGLHGILAAIGVMGAARVAFGRWPAVAGRDAILPLVGVVLAMTIELTLHEWTESRFGYYDAGFVWWTAGLSLVVVALAVATFATLIAPRGSAVTPVLAQALAAVMVGLIVLSNVGGLADGVSPESWPLAILVGLSAAYAAAVVVIGARRVSAG